MYGGEVCERVAFGIDISTVGAILIRIGMKMTLFAKVEENKEMTSCPGEVPGGA